ncbi:MULTISPECIES: photosystem II reaction center X protein [Spirulina sp. CCY15215]|nr:photosystem II reaction center X protein [Spirulina major]
MTPTLSNFFFSLIAGALVVVVPVVLGLLIISQSDKISRT